MAQSTLEILKKSIYQNDIKTFRTTLQTHGLPDEYFDYELLIKSLRLGRKRIVNLLLDKGCHVSKPGNINITTPLHIAVTKVGWSNIVLKLLARGAQVAVCNDNRDTPIHSAFMNDAAGSLIDLLLKFYTRETLVNAVNKNGLGLLHIACTRPQLDFVRDFMDIGGGDIFAQVSLQTNSIYAGYSPLHFAVKNGKHKIAKFLCQYEADVGILNRKGSTPLHLAVHRHDVKMIDILLKYADWNLNHTDSFGITHFMAACAGSDPEIVKQFLRIAADTSPNTLVDIISTQVKNLDNCDLAGYTPMHFAAEFGQLETMEILIDRGAHCTMTSQKLSPLDLARKRNHGMTIALLERHCRKCKTCKSDEIVVDMNYNENDKIPIEVFKFNSTFTENQEASLDECCFLDICPIPEQKDSEISDCELCTLQEIFLIENCVHEHRENDLNKNEMKAVETSASVICSVRVNFKFCKYFLHGRIFTLFATVVACLSIVACIVLICNLSLI